MIVEDGKAEAQCHFCNKEYHFYNRRTSRIAKRGPKIIKEGGSMDATFFFSSVLRLK